MKNKILTILGILGLGVISFNLPSFAGQSTTQDIDTVVCMAPEICEYQCDGIDDGIQIQSALDSKSKSIYIKEGRYEILSEITGTRDGIKIIGDGIDKTILVASSSDIKILNFGTGSGPNIQENFGISDLTLNLNDLAKWGLVASWINNINIERVKIIGFPTDAMAGMFLGAFSNQSEANFRFGNIKISNCIFDGGNIAWNWEMVTIDYVDDVQITNNKFLNKNGNWPGLLNYNAENAIIEGNIFKNTNVTTGGRGPVSINNNIFEDTKILLWTANNHTISNNNFQLASTSPNKSAGIVNQGMYMTPTGSEAPFYITATTSWENTNTVITGNNFEGCNIHCITSTVATDGDKDTLSSRNMIISNNIFASSTQRGINVVSRALTVTNNQFINNNKGGVASEVHAVVGGENIIFNNNTSRDDYDTVTGDLIINRDEYSDFITTTYVQVKDNNFNESYPIRYYEDGGALITATTSGITIDIEGNKGYEDIES